MTKNTYTCRQCALSRHIRIPPLHRDVLGNPYWEQRHKKHMTGSTGSPCNAVFSGTALDYYGFYEIAVHSGSLEHEPSGCTNLVAVANKPVGFFQRYGATQSEALPDAIKVVFPFNSQYAHPMPTSSADLQTVNCQYCGASIDAVNTSQTVSAINAHLSHSIGPRWVAGVDGCQAGWVVVALDLLTGQLQASVQPDFQRVIALPQAPVVIAVDIPIGLLTNAAPGGRDCEKLARKSVGRRSSSIFSAPARAALSAIGGFRAVSAANGTPRLSQQSYALLPKIKQVDDVLRQIPAPNPRVVEVHPELCFAKANRGAMRHSKKNGAGRGERLKVLRHLGFFSPLSLLGSPRPRGVAPDDILDACIACWSAMRVARGNACTLPTHPPTDSTGLQMAFWY